MDDDAFARAQGPGVTHPPPCRPRLALTGFRLTRVTPPTGLPVLLLSSSSMHAGVTTPADVGRCLCRSLPNLPTAFPPTPQGRLLHCGFRGLLTFTCVPARMVAELPKAALCHQSASIHVVTSMDRPGCYQPERQLLGEIRTRQKKAPYSRRTESNPLGSVERFQINSSSFPGLRLALGACAAERSARQS